MNPKNLSEGEILHVVKEKYQKQQLIDINYPSEVVTLPSKGMSYNSKSPLSVGELKMKYMTAKEEDILNNPRLLANGTAVNQAIKSMVISTSENVIIDVNDLKVNDYDSLLIYMRILGLGEIYTYKTKDSHGKEIVVTCDLTKFKIVPSKNVAENGLYTFVSSNNRTIKYELLTFGQDAELKKESIPDTSFIPKYRYMIKEIDGNTDKKHIDAFLEYELFSKDNRDLKQHITNSTAYIDTTFTHQNSKNEEEIFKMEITSDFFWE